jgi:hypothetical protein
MCVHVCVSLCVCVHVRVCVCTRVRVSKTIDVRVVRLRKLVTRVDTRIFIMHAHIYTQTHTHTQYTHTHTHIQRHTWPPGISVTTQWMNLRNQNTTKHVRTAIFVHEIYQGCFTPYIVMFRVANGVQATIITLRQNTSAKR